MLLSDYKNIIEQGENSAVEFKDISVKSDSLAKEMVAFANTSGGMIFLGIQDDGEITGIDSSNKNIEEWVMNISRNNVIPSINVTYHEFVIDNIKIACIDVPKGSDRPYQTLDSKYLIRVGSTNRTASINELMRLFQESGAFHYDTICVENTSINSLDFTKLDNYFSKYGLILSEESEIEKEKILINSDICCSNKKTTVAGQLIFGINPAKFLPQSGISFVHFKGKDISDELIDKQNLDGTLDFVIDRALAVIKNNIKTPSNIIGTKRSDSVSYSDKLFRELLVNACCHRNYAISGSKIRVFMFENRIEFISPGKLPNTITIEKLKYGVSYAVNPVIVKFMENMRYIDRIGRGIPMVYKETQERGKYLSFQEIGEEFKVTLEL